MSEIGPRNTYKFLFSLDTINLIQIIINCLHLRLFESKKMMNFLGKFFFYFIFEFEKVQLI